MNYQNEMRRLVDDFVTHLADLWRQAAIESMMGAGGLGGSSSSGSSSSGSGSSSGEARRGPGRPPGSRNVTSAASQDGGSSSGGSSASASRSRNASRGGKRTSDELEQLSTQFLDFVKKNPGLRIEQINKGLGTTTKDLALPIRKLVSEGTVKVKGAKRATTYTMR